MYTHIQLHKLCHTPAHHTNTRTPHYRCTKNPLGCVCWPSVKPVSQPEICVFDHNPERAPLLQQSTSIINSDGDTTPDNEKPYHVYSWYIAKINRSTYFEHKSLPSFPDDLYLP